MRYLILLFISSLLLSSLAACVATNKTRQNMVVYDFGLPAHSEKDQQITSKILIEEPITAEPLNHNNIRYRLNYLNPARIFYYTESRWASTPSALFSGKLGMMVNTAQNPLNCSLKLKIEAFDHVFQTATTSTGVVQLTALLVENKTQKVISSQLISESAAAPTADAQGGTAALSQASEVALKKAINWGNNVAETSALCQ